MQEAVTVSSLLTDVGTVIPNLLTIVWDLITANPLLIFFAGCGLVSLGFTYWRKAKGAAKN